jgi:hypothetical protein
VIDWPIMTPPIHDMHGDGSWWVHHGRKKTHKKGWGVCLSWVACNASEALSCVSFFLKYISRCNGPARQYEISWFVLFHLLCNRCGSVMSNLKGNNPRSHCCDDSLPDCCAVVSGALNLN